MSERGMFGDLTPQQKIERIIRVDQAGEYGAVRIYEGQLAVLGRRKKSGPAIQHMAAQEREHLTTFNRLMAERRVRPTILQPLWHIFGFAMGAGTALMGEKVAMACTVAVEEVIDEHYANQSTELGAKEDELREIIDQFRADEVEHRDQALAHGAEEAPAYPLLSLVIKTAARLAIKLSERI